MYRDVILLVGSPGCGKTWITNQLKDKFHVMEHDMFKEKDFYIYSVAKAARDGDKTILANTPFGLSEIMDSLKKENIKVIPVFVIEKPETLKQRYMKREGREIPKGHLTRQNTYFERAQELRAFFGSSTDVLAHLRSLANA